MSVCEEVTDEGGGGEGKGAGTDAGGVVGQGVFRNQSKQK